MKKDLAVAAQLYKQACEGEESSACFNLAILYEEGRGVKKNTKTAIRYYELACELGDDEGCEKAKRLKR